MPGIAFTEMDPAPELAGHIARYWYVEVGRDVPAGHRHRVVADGCMALIAVESGSTRHFALQGPHDTPQMVPVEPGDRYWGIRFWPDTGGLVLPCSPAELGGQVVPAGRYLGDALAPMLDRITSASDTSGAREACDHVMQPLVAGAPVPDPAVRLAVLAINASCGRAPVTSLGAQGGIGVRQLQRRFLHATGLTLKTYARIRRLRSSLTHLLEPSSRSWGTVAADFGYADQAHLIREFRRLAGATPGEIAAYVADIEHEAVRP